MILVLCTLFAVGGAAVGFVFGWGSGKLSSTKSTSQLKDERNEAQKNLIEAETALRTIASSSTPRPELEAQLALSQIDSRRFS